MKTKLSLIFLFIVAIACKNSKKEESQNQEAPTENTIQLTDDQAKNAGVVLGQLEQKDLSSVLRVNGVIDVPPQNMVSISAPLGGYLKSSKLLPGLPVSKGEVIATMEDPQYIQLQQDYLIAKSRLTFIEGEFNRQKELNDSKAVSDKVFQLSQADYTGQKILVKSLSERLQLINVNPEHLNENTLSRSTTIYSPINGYVSKVNVNIGKYVKPEDVLFEIVNPEDIHLALTIFEKDINKLFIGQKLTAFTNNNPEKKYDCEIILIGKDFGNDRSVVVHCHFDKYDAALVPGMFMNAELRVNSSNSWTLPSDAIVTFENKQYVFMESSSNQYEIKEVKTGVSENGYQEIINFQDLTKRSIVTKGAYSLLMKLKNTSDE